MSKRELIQQCKDIRDSYQLGETIGNADREWLMENVFPHHPDWDWFATRGIVNVYVDKADHGTTCFYFGYRDGSHSSFSYIKAINNIKRKTK